MCSIRDSALDSKLIIVESVNLIYMMGQLSSKLKYNEDSVTLLEHLNRISRFNSCHIRQIILASYKRE